MGLICNAELRLAILLCDVGAIRLFGSLIVESHLALDLGFGGVETGVGEGVLAGCSAVRRRRARSSNYSSDTHEAPSLSATRSPQSERLDNRRHLANSRCAFQSVGHMSQRLREAGSVHSKDERVRTQWSRRLRAPRASGRSSYPCACLDVFRLGPICQSGVVRGVVRPASFVVRIA